MAGGLHRLSATRVATAKSPGRYADGGGLYLQVARWNGKTVTRSWLFRYMRAGRARQMGLGATHTVSLAEARERARLARQALLDGIDPIDAREAERRAILAAEAKRITFREAAIQAMAVFRDEWRNAKHAEQWTATLETYAYPVIGNLDVAAIDTGHVVRILQPIWVEKHETARRVRQRLERILGWAAASHYRPRGDNPAALASIGPLLASPKKLKRVRHQPAMPFGDVPGFVTRLRGSGSVSAKALEFTILTAVRTNEAIGAESGEIDLAAKVWTIPGSRTKSGREHRVPLSPRAIALLKSLPSLDGGRYLFPGAVAGKPLSNMAMLELLRGMTDEGFTVHGFRSSFRDWAAEQTNYPREVAEAALAHVVKDATEAAYRRGDALEKRRKLMDAWAAYCDRPRPSGSVVKMIRGRA